MVPLQPVNQKLVLDGDLIGPIMLFTVFMFCLVLQGKTHVDVVYTLFITSCVMAYVIINLLSQKGQIDLYCTMSMFGYGLTPIISLAFLNIFFTIKASFFGSLIACMMVLWSTVSWLG